MAVGEEGPLLWARRRGLQMVTLHDVIPAMLKRRKEELSAGDEEYDFAKDEPAQQLQALEVAGNRILSVQSPHSITLEFTPEQRRDQAMLTIKWMQKLLKHAELDT